MRDDGRKLAHLPVFLRDTTSISAAIRELSDVQGNILRKFACPRVLHVLIRFDRTRLPETQSWIASFAERHVPSSAEQLSRSTESPLSANFFLAAEGYRALGYDPPPDPSFRGGMKKANLNDPPIEEWDEPFQTEFDAMVSLWCRDVAQAWKEVGTLGDIAEQCLVETGEELPGGKEHFGFVDGISQPLFLEEEIEHTSKWSARTPLHVVLARDPYGRGEQSFGTYAVFRKLEQDVALFRRGTTAMAAQLGVDPELAAAMVIGRFEDGSPLAATAAAGRGPVNDFAYDEDAAGARCPFASHVRRTNPRGELDHVAHAPDWQNRIVRRGIPYGQPGDAHVGMLFLCFQSDIASQFELIQNNWCNFPHFPVLRTGHDPLVGQRNTWDHFEGQKWPAGYESEQSATFGFPQCVTLRGGEYFFAPSCSFLRSLARGNE